ncbi:hypothetical protein EMCRGX_G027699 [Ephydatia muelleri]
MGGEFIKSARETLILFLKSIPPGCSFNIIGFGDDYESLFPSSVPYNQENLDRAIQHAECVEADLGGTELFPPLQFIFGQQLLEGLPRQVFVLTDGSVIRSLKQALQPSVTNLRVEFQLPAGFEVTQAPSKAPVLFSGDKAVVYGILKGPSELMSPVDCTASLKGQILDQPLEYSIPFEVPGNSPSFSIPITHHLAAKALIKEGLGEGWREQEARVSAPFSNVRMSALPKTNKRGGFFGGLGGPSNQIPRVLRRSVDQEAASFRLSAAPVCYSAISFCASEKKCESRSASGPGRTGPTGDTLSNLISLQQADGLWKLDDGIAKVLSKSLKELSDACPVKCNGGVATLWATALCVVYLELKHPSQKDEWELIAMKAELWLDAIPSCWS